MEALRKNHKRIISHKQAIRIIQIIIFVFVFDFFLFPLPTLAQKSVEEMLLAESVDKSTDNIIEESKEKNLKLYNDRHFLPKNSDAKVLSVSTHVITSYNSEVGQCDDTPCITANGFNVCEHGIEDTIAANFLKFGTKVRIPELFGDKIFIVRDRMNQRYSDRVDVWMVEKADSRNFGVKVARIEVLE